MKLGDVPFSDLKVGDALISCIGSKGWIGGLWAEGEIDALGRRADYGGHILMLWPGSERSNNLPPWSLTWHHQSQVEYVGRK